MAPWDLLVELSPNFLTIIMSVLLGYLRVETRRG
jgi:hypothetical protein